jgi:hypothetical protein
MILFSLLLEFLDFINLQEVFRERNQSNYIILAVLLVPILEEIIFRLPLLHPKFLGISIVILLLTYSAELYSSIVQTQVLISIFLGLVVFLALIISFFFLIKPNKLLLFLAKKPNVVVYISVFIFGFSHLFVNANILSFLVFGFLLFFSTVHILLGFTLSFIRINMGFLWAIIGHSAYNFAIIIITSFLTTF